MFTWVILSSAFFIGLQSALHCTLMCGPLVKMVSSSFKDLKYAIWANHLGRGLGYVTIGIAIFSITWVQPLLKWSGLLSILIAAVMLYSVVFPKNKLSSFHSKLHFRLSQFIHQKLAKHKKSYFFPFSLGLLTATIPCSTIYLALAGAAIMPSFWWLTAYMLVFYATTLIHLTFLGTVLQKLSYLLKENQLKWMQVATLLVLMLSIIYRFYVSPEPTSPVMSHSSTIPLLLCR